MFCLLSSFFFFLDFTFYKGASRSIVFIFSLCSNASTLESTFEYRRQKWKKKKNTHFKISSLDEVFTRLFFLPEWNFISVFLTGMSSSRDEISSRQKRVNSKRHFTTDRDDFIPGWNFTWKRPLRVLVKLSVS